MSKINLSQSNYSRKKIRRLKLKNVILKRLPSIKKEDKIILFTNPNQFERMILEKINPNHVGIIWGYRRRKYRKIKGNNWIKVAKIQFTEICIIMNNQIINTINYYTEYLSMYALKVGIFGIIFYILSGILFYTVCFKLGGLNVR